MRSHTFFTFVPFLAFFLSNLSHGACWQFGDSTYIQLSRIRNRCITYAARDSFSSICCQSDLLQTAETAQAYSPFCHHFNLMVDSCTSLLTLHGESCVHDQLERAPTRQKTADLMTHLGQVADFPLAVHIVPQPACPAGQSRIATSQDPIAAFLRRQNPKGCLASDLQDDFQKMLQYLKVSSSQTALLKETYKVLQTLYDNRTSWRDQARRRGETLYSNWITRSGQKVEVYIKPDGELILSYLNRSIGKGSNKEAVSLLSFQRGKLVRQRVQLAPLNKIYGAREIEKEWNIYSKLLDSQKRLPPGQSLIGLATAERITLRDGTQVLIQERFDNDLAKARLLQTPQGSQVALQYFSGLAHLHSLGVVHGDLKGGNVFVKKDPTGVRVAISDFGLTADPRIKVQSRGTAGYEAPEMVSFKGATSNQVSLMQKRDIYASGIMLLDWINVKTDLWAMCGHLFRSFKSWDTYGTCIQQKAPILYQRVESRIPLECRRTRSCKEAIVADCIHPDPQKRPTAEEARQRIQQLSTF